MADERKQQPITIQEGGRPQVVQGGYGRGCRQHIEKDSLDVTTGLPRRTTIGSPIVGIITNKDHRLNTAPAVTRPRPAHADLAGSVKWLTTDCRETPERASARETPACSLADGDAD